jgi:ubiquitin
MNKRISLQELIALNNTPKAKALIVKYGYKPARSYNDLIFKLIQFTKEHREDALREMAEIHPHRDLILNYLEMPIIEEKKSNCDGDNMCPVCKAKQQLSSFEGNISTENQNAKNTNTNTTSNMDFKTMLPMIAITSLVTASLVILINRAR